MKTRPRATPRPGKGKPIVDLEPGQCKFAVGSDKQHRHLFCGAPCNYDKPYCDAHAKRVYQP